jgi:Ca2+-binding RTX toxin-like protein
VVTTWGVPEYTAADLAANPAEVLARDPAIVSQFVVTPTSGSIVGTARNDRLHGTTADDVILGAAGGDKLHGGKGGDYLDGGKGNDNIAGGLGDDHIFGRKGNDRLSGDAGDDILSGGEGRDWLSGGAGSNIFEFAHGFGNDRIADFHATPRGGQDFLDISAFGIRGEDFASRVKIFDAGANTRVVIDAEFDQTILLIGIRNAGTLTQADFLL